jgi:hypothetical protein
MGQSRGQTEPWSADLIEKVSKDIEIKLNNSDWLINVEKRDLALMKITKLLLEIIKP